MDRIVVIKTIIQITTLIIILILSSCATQTTTKTKQEACDHKYILGCDADNNPMILRAEGNIDYN